MKASAPEKIYIPITEGQEIAINEWGSIPLSQYEHKRVVENIEYTRTDALIEKACDWLRTHSEMDFFELIPVGNYCGAGNLNKKKMIEDFRNYMKGE